MEIKIWLMQEDDVVVSAHIGGVAMGECQVNVAWRARVYICKVRILVTRTALLARQSGASCITKDEGRILEEVCEANNAFGAT